MSLQVFIEFRRLHWFKMAPLMRTVGAPCAGREMCREAGALLVNVIPQGYSGCQDVAGILGVSTTVVDALISGADAELADRYFHQFTALSGDWTEAAYASCVMKLARHMPLLGV